MLRLLIIVTSIAIYATLGAQPPNSQLYVFDLRATDSLLTLSSPRYLSSFNQGGYNDHPNWADDNLLYASVKTVDMAQPDIYSFDLATNTRRRLTQTESGEYSPKRVMGANRFSSVRQEYTAGDTVLRLWDFPSDLSDNGRPVITLAEGVGYYEWLNNDQLVLFLVTNPNQLVMTSVTGDNRRTLATNTGRTFTRLTNGNLVYVDKSTTPARLVEQNLYKLEEAPKAIAPMRPDTEDFLLLPDGTYLAGGNSKLYRLNPKDDEPRWTEAVDLTFYGVRRVSRMALNRRGQLALVAE